GRNKRVVLTQKEEFKTSLFQQNQYLRCDPYSRYSRSPLTWACIDKNLPSDPEGKPIRADTFQERRK
ncbi:MAG: hypothetical protein JXM79_11930, partial [Sedimentisphaerales bacterium]|nr:hypothetical protein [Sedimentisphaerales bacterium]